jgi:hypothetical protein
VCLIGGAVTLLHFPDKILWLLVLPHPRCGGVVLAWPQRSLRVAAGRVIVPLPPRLGRAGR